MPAINAIDPNAAVSGNEAVTAYLMAFDECQQSGPTSSACATALALQGAALAAGLDPNLVNAGRKCLQSQDVESCAKVATATALTAACVGATAGAATAACGPLASIITNVAWPVIWGTLSAAFDVATSLVSVGLEAVGLKDEPQFADLANPMHAQVVNQFNTSISQTAKAIAEGISKSRKALGMNDQTILVRERVRIKEGFHKGEMQWSESGKQMWLDAAAESLIWDRLANQSSFAAGFTNETGYGSVGLKAGVMGSDRKANIESAYTLISLVPTWSVSWDYAWQRDDCFKNGADALSRFYGHRFEALQRAINEAMAAMIELESMNPNTEKALARGDFRAVSTDAAKPTKSGAGSTLLAVGVVGVLGVGGYLAWRRYGK